MTERVEHGGYHSTRVLEHASDFCRFWGLGENIFKGCERVKDIPLSRFQPVAHTRFGNDVTGAGGIRLNLAPQVADIDVQGMIGTFVA